VAPPGNQAANRENKHQPIVSEENVPLNLIQKAKLMGDDHLTVDGIVIEAQATLFKNHRR